MKVRRVWECECGETKLLHPVGKPQKLIVKGNGYQQTQHVGYHSMIVCRACVDKYTVMPLAISISSLKRFWECGCGEAVALHTERGDIVLKGTGFIYGSPPSHASCTSCHERYRISPDVTWASHIAAKEKKRQGSRKNRRAKKRRAQKSF